jgi:hypothetical protein
MKNRSHAGVQVVLALLLFLATATTCSDSARTTPTDTPEALPVPTERSATSTTAVTPTSEPTATQTSTPLVPSATSLPTATSTATPTTEPTATHTVVPATPTETPAPSVRYQLTFEATWSEATHPLGFPPNPHFSGLIGATHMPAVRLWAEGETATPGMKNMAETGAKSPLDSEIAVLMENGEACELISGDGISASPGSITVELTVTRECPLVSVVSMIAPSPDWFLGVAGLSLLDEGGWTEETVVELLPYDAGTDSGEAYTSPDQPTGDPEPIHRIEVKPFRIDGVVVPLGTFTFTRLGE